MLRIIQHSASFAFGCTLKLTGLASPGSSITGPLSRQADRKEGFIDGFPMYIYTHILRVFASQMLEQSTFKTSLQHSSRLPPKDTGELLHAIAITPYTSFGM